jgi:hypothetical protein
MGHRRDDVPLVELDAPANLGRMHPADAEQNDSSWQNAEATGRAPRGRVGIRIATEDLMCLEDLALLEGRQAS